MRGTASLGAAAALALAMGLLAQPAAHAVSNSPAAAAGTDQYVVKVDTGASTCTGALIDPQWVATAASCFQANPADYASLASGVPAARAKVLLDADTPARDTAGIGVIHVERHPDRDLALVRLARPVSGVTPPRIATNPPQAGEAVAFTGFGRTHDTWIPAQKHTGAFTAGASDATTTAFSPATPGAALCAGDSGAPGIRTTPTGPELVAVNSRSGQKGCLYASTATTADSVGSRVDDAAAWISSMLAFGAADGSTAQIRATGSNGNCLTPRDGKAETAPCPGNTARKWQLTRTGTDAYTLKNTATGTCLTGAADPSGTPQLSLAGCDPANTLAQWQLQRLDDGTTAIRNAGNQATAQFQPTASTAPTTQTTGTSPTAAWVLGSGDYFDLSASDVVAVSPDGVAYNLYQYEATGVPGLLNGTQMGTGWTDLTAGFVTDWNGDGFQDLLVQWNDGKIRLYTGSTAPFGGYTVIGQGWQGWKLSVGRWKDTDTRPSIVAYSTTTGTLRHYENLNGTGIGAATEIGQGWAGLEIVQMDFDKDSHTDIVAKTTAGELKLYRTNGAGTFIAETPATIGWGWDVITAISPTSGFAGTGTTGMLARTTGGDLRYYPILADRAWGTPVTVGWGWAPLHIFRSTMP
ncbi:hypothetical protein SCMU_39520 [Sinomonas cyclohexanicum]|uniref:Peptidase S1 domain-containing protein n=2 Tax=Sinomonas cyclohexanicum TaxID=322009 RepID=A0ABN6FN69_SINCY|nr:hypothetical protein SCMU_39520 [Corynebacterium cyclohexanicum]